MTIHIEEGSDKPLTKKQIKELKKIKMPKYKMSKCCRNILRPNYKLWREK